MPNAETPRPMKTVRALASMLFVALAVLSAGCQDSNPLSGAKLYPVKGKVILADGKPLASGTISFVANKSTVTANADIGSDGEFSFKGDGLPEGEYRVRVETTAAKRSGKKLTAELPFALKYLDEDASKLTATVTPDASKNNFEFKLDAKDAATSAGPGGGRGR
jgi:hypothetical protein